MVCLGGILERKKHLERIDELLIILENRNDFTKDKTFERIGYHLNRLNKFYTDDHMNQEEESMLHKILKRYLMIKVKIEKQQLERSLLHQQEKRQVGLVKKSYLNTSAYQVARQISQYK